MKCYFATGKLLTSRKLFITAFLLAIYYVFLMPIQNASANDGSASTGSAFVEVNYGGSSGADPVCDPNNTSWQRKASISCGASFRLYQYGANITQDNLAATSGLSLEVAKDSGQTANVGMWNNADGSTHIEGWGGFQEGTIKNCSKSEYFLRFGYEMIGGLDDPNNGYGYQVGLGQVNALSDSSLRQWWQTAQTLQEAGGELKYVNTNAASLESFLNYGIPGYPLDTNKLKQAAADSPRGLRVSLELAKRIFKELEAHDLLEGWDLHGYTGEEALLHATGEDGKGVGGLCVDLDAITNASEYLTTKSGIEYSTTGNFGGYVNEGTEGLRAKWTGLAKNPDDNHQASDSLVIEPKDYVDKVKVRFRHAILFSLNDEAYRRPGESCIDWNGVDAGAINWPLQDPDISTPYTIYQSNSENRGDFYSSGTMSTNCSLISAGYNGANENGEVGGAPNLWRRGNRADSDNLWVYDLMRYYEFDLSSIKNGGTITHCETIRLDFSNLSYSSDGTYYYTDTPINQMTRACFTVTVGTVNDPCLTNPASCQSNPPSDNTTICTHDGVEATNYGEYGNTTGFSGVRNRTENAAGSRGYRTISDGGSLWYDTSKTYKNKNSEKYVRIQRANAGYTNDIDTSARYANSFVYAKPGDVVQFHHCLTFGSQGTSPRASIMPYNWFKLNVSVQGGDDNTRTVNRRYLFRNANKYTQKTFLPKYTAQPRRVYSVDIDTYSYGSGTRSRYTTETLYNSDGSYLNPVQDFGSSRVKNYTLLIESPSLNTSGYNCQYYYNDGSSRRLQFASYTPGYQIHGFPSPLATSYRCPASRGGSTETSGVSPSDVGKIITQYFDYDYTESWRYRYNINYGGYCEHDCGHPKNYRWYTNSYNNSYSDAVSHYGKNYYFTYTCHYYCCECCGGSDDCHSKSDVYEYESKSTPTSYSNIYWKTCDDFYTRDRVRGELGYCRYTTTRTEDENRLPQGHKSATVKIPYNFTTSVYARDNDSYNGVPAGGVTTTTVSMKVNPRLNPDVSKTEYATIMPSKSKIQVVEFIIDDSVMYDSVNTTSITGGGIDEGYGTDTSGNNSLCQYISVASNCNRVSDTSFSEVSVGAGFNKEGVLNGGKIFTKDIDTTVPDVEVGQKYCVAVGVWPADSHNKPTEVLTFGANDNIGILETGNQWHISRAACRTITKTPSAQVWNGDTKASNISTAVSNKQVQAGFTGENISNNRLLFGSWDEHNVLAKTITDFASGATLGYTATFNPTGGMKVARNVATSDICKYSPLTIANTDCNNLGVGKNNNSDIFSTSNIITKLRSRYLEPVKTYGSTNSYNIGNIRNNVIATGGTTNSTQKNYYYLKSDSDLVLSGYKFLGRQDGDSANSDPTYVIYVNGTLTIAGNLCYEGNTSCENNYGQVPVRGIEKGFDSKIAFSGQDSYKGFSYSLLANGQSYYYIKQLPQVLIFAKDIKITSNVTQIDAWLFAIGKNLTQSNFSTAAGTLYTCSDFYKGTTPADKANECGYQLVINGPVFAKNLQLGRTAGSYPGKGYSEYEKNDPTAQSIANDGSVTPAEIFNLRPDAYLWAYGQAQDTRQASSTYLRELPPRY